MWKRKDIKTQSKQGVNGKIFHNANRFIQVPQIGDAYDGCYVCEPNHITDHVWKKNQFCESWKFIKLHRVSAY